jgi:Cu/Ag efflux pump CusA
MRLPSIINLRWVRLSAMEILSMRARASWAAMAGIVLMLFFTHTRLSVPALMGALMCVGVATANSILVVSFAKEKLAEHGDAVKAAIEAGNTRFRPVIMTALFRDRSVAYIDRSVACIVCHGVLKEVRPDDRNWNPRSRRQY